MKKLSTKTVATLMVVTAAATAVPGLTRVTKASQFDKLLQRHDRKGEIRAQILNISPFVLKKQLRVDSFDAVISKAGMTKRTFRLALLGMLRNELRQRGWTTAKIDSYLRGRQLRMLPVVA